MKYVVLRRRAAGSAILLGIIGAVLLLATTGGAKAQRQAEDSELVWTAFSMGELRDQRAAQGRPWLGFLTVPTLSTGLYVIPAGGVDNQSAHELDEVYYIIAGKATLFVDGERRPSKAGDVIFVRQGIDHRFEDIEEKLEVLVFFAGEGEE